LGRHEEAEAAYREAARLDPADVDIHVGLGTALSSLGRMEEAGAAYREALRVTPANAAACNSLGNTLFSLGRHEEAEAAYREAARLDPADVDARTSLGSVLAYLGRFAEGESAYREARGLDPGNAEVYNGLGYVLACLGRFAEAEAAYRQAQRLDSDLVNAHNGIGRLYLKLLGQIDEAAVALREALRLDPHYPSAHANLGSLSVITGELDEARSSFLEATQSAPAKHAFSELVLGALETDTIPPAGEEHFEAALAALAEPVQPTFLTPFERAEIKALALTALNRPQEATATLRKALTIRSKADVFQPHHYALFNTPKITPLIDVWQEIIAQDPAAVGPWGSM
jgi:Flp pilus assembly protein TadD